MSVTIESKPTTNSANFDPITSSVVQCVVEDSLDGNGLACHLELARRMESEATTNFADFDAIFPDFPQNIQERCFVTSSD